MTSAGHSLLLRRHDHLSRIGLVVGMLSVALAVGALAELAFADLASGPNVNTSVAERLVAVWKNGDHLHYSVHLATGRLLDLCPCTAGAAATEYWRASFHARSARQLERVTREPRTALTARMADVLELPIRWLHWNVGEAVERGKLRMS